MSFEQLVICHCAPVLCGIKVSNLVSCSFAEYPLLQNEVEKMDDRFKPFGLRCTVLCECKKFALVFVYNKQMLLKTLLESENCNYLEMAGYECSSLEKMLKQLSLRLKERHVKGSHDACPVFPHEIGVFLGYPIEDVIGFSENGGRNFKYSGYWKVYGNPDVAKKIFSIYELCCKKCSVLAMNGSSVEEVIKYADLKSA